MRTVRVDDVDVQDGPAFSTLGLPDAPSIEQQIAEDQYACLASDVDEVAVDMARWDAERSLRELARQDGAGAVLRAVFGVLRENCAAVS